MALQPLLCAGHHVRVALLLALSALGGVWGISLSNATKNGTHRERDCHCLPWGALYRWKKADCGDTFEVIHTEMAGKTKKAALHLDHGCRLVFPNLVTSRCMKAHTGSHLTHSEPNVFKMDFNWCYVLSTCHTLNGGRKISESMAWRVCEHDDEAHGDLAPKELYEQIKFAQVTAEPNLIAMAAYPYIEKTWNDVASYFGEEGPELEPNWVRKLDSIAESGRPHMICDSLQEPGNGHPEACGPPYTNYVMVGKQVWYFPRFREPVCKYNCPVTTPAPTGYPKRVDPYSVQFD